MKRREFFRETAFAGVAMALESRALAAGEVTLYLDPVKGADANAGTKAAPLKTLAAAAARVNQLQEPGANANAHPHDAVLSGLERAS